MKNKQNNLKNISSYYNYTQLFQKYNNYIKKIINEGNWVKLINIFNDSPPIFSNFSDLIVSSLKTNSINPINEENNTFHLAYVFLLNLLKENTISIAKHDENLFFELLKKCLDVTNFNDQHLDLFIQVFGNIIIQKEFERILENQRILAKLVVIWPDSLVDFFPKIVETRNFSLAFLLIKSNPELVKKYPNNSRVVLEHSAFRFDDTKSIITILERNNTDLIPHFEKIRHTKKQEFCENLTKSECNTCVLYLWKSFDFKEQW
ncbi:MAG: hypothetical protein ACFFDN_10995, partial [Candidatus Hodarchaeota archaeon]